MRLRYWILLFLLVVDLILFFISWYGWTVEDYELYYLFILLSILVLFILFIAGAYITARARWMLFFKRRARMHALSPFFCDRTFLNPESLFLVQNGAYSACMQH